MESSFLDKIFQVVYTFGLKKPNSRLGRCVCSCLLYALFRCLKTLNSFFFAQK